VRQRQDVAELIARRGWTHVGTYEDNDRSAYSGRQRPAWEALWSAVRAGDIDVVVAWNPDRLYRRVRDLVRVADLVDAYGVRIETCTAGPVDFTTPEGRLVAQIIGAVAEKASADEARRVKRWHRARAEQGLPPTSGTRLFGYHRERVAGQTVWRVDPVEGPIVGEVFRRVLAGEAVVALRDELNRRGLTTSQGSLWTTTALRRLLGSPSVAALRRLGDGTLVDGVWPALVDRDTWEATQRALAARGRSGRRESLMYLLSGGLGVCGRCGSTLTGHRKGDRRRYECRASGEGDGGCFLSIAAEPTERLVADVLLSAIDPTTLARLRARHTTGADDGVVDRLSAIEAELEALADDYAEGRLSRAAYIRATSRLERSTDELESQLSSDGAPDMLRSLGADPESLRARWDAASMSWRRAFARLLVERVTVAPSTSRGGRFDPERLSFQWTT
jgi:site-specific DNA recombinase